MQAQLSNVLRADAATPADYIRALPHPAPGPVQVGLGAEVWADIQQRFVRLCVFPYRREGIGIDAQLQLAAFFG